MIEFDPAARASYTTDRTADLARAWQPGRPRSLRRSLGFALVSLGLRLAASCPPQGASGAAYVSVR